MAHRNLCITYGMQLCVRDCGCERQLFGFSQFDAVFHQAQKKARQMLFAIGDFPQTTPSVVVLCRDTHCALPRCALVTETCICTGQFV
jgi:hypothetical protein